MSSRGRIVSSKGFTVIEVLVAVMIISFIGLGVSRFLLATTRSLVHSNTQKKVQTLAGMVFEQYNSYVAVNYLALKQGYDRPSPITPATFFGTADNLGFEGLKLTTRTDYAANKSTCSVTLEISWTQDGQLEKKQFTKIYAETPPLEAGGVVEIWTRPCETCAGFPGFRITAPPTIGNTPIIGFTDANGRVVLRGVKIADNMAFTAQKFPGGWKDGDAIYPLSQGYYAPNGVGGYVFTSTRTLNVTLEGPNILTFDEFRPLGTLRGHLSNKLAGHPISGMLLNLKGKVAVMGATGPSWVNAAYDTHLGINTPLDGSYAFYNLLPGNHEIIVRASGPMYSWRLDSEPAVQLTSPQFKWGYTGDPYVNAQMVPQYPQAPEATLDLTINRKGWFDITLVTVGGDPVAGATLSWREHHPQWGDQGQRQAVSGSDGHVRLYNMVIPGEYDYYKFSASRPSQGTTPYLYHSWENWSCGSGTCLDQENRITLVMNEGYTLQGQIIDNTGVFVGSSVTFPSPDGATQTGTLEASGNFAVSGFVPDFFNPDVAGNPRTIPLKYIRPLTTPIQVRLLGTMRDTASGKLVPVNGIRLSTGTVTASAAYLPAPNNSVPASDTDGRFDIQVRVDHWSGPLPSVSAVCDATTRVCTIAPMNVNTLSIPLILMQSPKNLGWYSGHHLTVTHAQTISNILWNMYLHSYPITGTIRNEAGQPLSGVGVDPWSSYGYDGGRSDSNGHYMAVGGLYNTRTATNPGFVAHLTAIDSTNWAYQNAHVFNAPAPPLWTTPLAPAFHLGEGLMTQDFTMCPTAGCAGGGGGGGSNN